MTKMMLKFIVKKLCLLGQGIATASAPVLATSGATPAPQVDEIAIPQWCNFSPSAMCRRSTKTACCGWSHPHNLISAMKISVF